MQNFFKKINNGVRHLFVADDKKKCLTPSSGFTIIETLVAIFILLITTTGPLAFAQTGLRTAFLARDQITAFYLAQESIETLKNIKDTNQLANGADWLDGFESCDPGDIGDTTSCDINLLDNSFIDCLEKKCDFPLRYEESTGQFSISSASNSGNPSSKYTRTVYVTLLSDDEIQVIVDVSWESQFLAEKRIVVQENIYKKY